MGDQLKVSGATGTTKVQPNFQAQLARPGQKTISHEFLQIPECSDPLLGQDLLHKLKVHLSFETATPTVQMDNGPHEFLGMGIKVLALYPEGEGYLLLVSPKVLNDNELLHCWMQEIPGVWAEHNPLALTVNLVPLVIKLIPQAIPVWLKQYPISLKARQGITRHILRLKEHEILKSFVSPWNTPLLPVQKL